MYVYIYICHSFIPYFINLTTKQNPSTNGIETFEERDAMRSSRAKREERPATKAWSRGSRWSPNWGNADNTVEITLWKPLEYGFTLKNWGVEYLEDGNHIQKMARYSAKFGYLTCFKHR